MSKRASCKRCGHSKPIEEFEACLSRKGVESRRVVCIPCRTKNVRGSHQRRDKSATKWADHTVLYYATMAYKPVKLGQRTLCGGLPPEWWHPWTDHYNDKTKREVPPLEGGKFLCDSDKAIALCRECPARLECLTHAVENVEDWGIWGGLREGQRWMGKKAGLTPKEMIEKYG